MRFLNKSGFSLIELMTVVVIIGILASTSVPKYQQYITKAKITEAYTINDELTKRQISYFAENNHFHNMYQNPAYTSSRVVQNLSQDWVPAPIGSKVFFSYRATIGKVTSAGTECTGSSGACGVDIFTPSASEYGIIKGTASLGGSTCNSNYNAQFFLGSAPVTNTDWALIIAIGDLDNDFSTSKCTTIFRSIQARPTTNRTPNASALVTLFPGD